MKIPRRLAARALGVLAILGAPLFAIYGWWVLAVSGVMAVVAAWITPRPRQLGTPSRTRALFDGIKRRFRPHSWRPRNR